MSFRNLKTTQGIALDQRYGIWKNGVGDMVFGGNIDHQEYLPGWQTD
jgi:hypothetical protein